MPRPVLMSCPWCDWSEKDYADGVKDRDECPECGHAGFPFDGSEGVSITL